MRTWVEANPAEAAPARAQRRRCHHQTVTGPRCGISASDPGLTPADAAQFRRSLRYRNHMSTISLHFVHRSSSRTGMLAVLLLAFGCSPAAAQETKPAPAPAPADVKDKDKAADKEALPADAHVAQSIQLDGNPLHYTVSVGALPVNDNTTGKKIGEVVCTAYTMEGQDRPVTFALNGGPGAASVFLNFGAIGPKHLAFGDEGDSPSDPSKLTDNPGTWLDFTDLVFIDPVGTGYSRSLVAADEAKKQFYSTDADIHYLSRIIYDWLVKNGRLLSLIHIS